MKKLLMIIFLSVTLAGYAQDTNQLTKHFNVEKGIALQGYDPVAYFKGTEAMKGLPTIAVKHQGITYYFANVANKQLFLSNPNQYLPQYGGWCAFAMGDYGKKVPVNPETFKILDGKLYLFYNAYFNNTLKSWNKNEAALKANADKNWAKTINQ